MEEVSAMVLLSVLPQPTAIAATVSMMEIIGVLMILVYGCKNKR
jgi:hypothetical protein